MCMFLSMYMINKKELKAIILEALDEYFAAQTTPVTKNDFIDVAQAATLLNLARATIYERRGLNNCLIIRRARR